MIGIIELEKLPEPQRIVVDWLLKKGWVEPFLYHRSVTLGQHHIAVKKRSGCLVKDWSRPTIRVTPTGRIIGPEKQP